jgi:hypothetical protein
LIEGKGGKRGGEEEDDEDDIVVRVEDEVEEGQT